MNTLIEKDKSNLRIRTIDIAKGIGIILVIMGHLLPENSYLRSVIYSFHMPLFFILSGMVLKPSYTQWKFWRSITAQRKLFITYLFYSTIFLSFDIAIRWAVLKEMKITAVVWNAYQTSSFFGINVLWFLATTIIAKSIYQYTSGLKNNKLFVGLSVIGFIVVGIVREYISMEKMAVSITKLLMYFPLTALLRPVGVLIFFSLGIYLKPVLHTICNQQKKLHWGLLIEISLLCFGFSCYFVRFSDPIDFHYIEYGNVSLAFLLGVSGSIAVILLCCVIEKIGIFRRVFEFFGKNSLFIMVVHEYLFVSRVVQNILRLIGIDNIGLQIVLVVVVSGALAYMITPFVNRGIEWLDRLFSRKNAFLMIGVKRSKKDENSSYYDRF